MLAFTMLIVVLPMLTLAQARGEAQADYLRAVGLDQDAQELEQDLFERLQIHTPSMQEARQKGLARFFAFVMTVSGLNAEKVDRLEAEGIDIAHAITADARPLTEQALLADLVMVGEVTSLADIQEPDDGYTSSIGVAVQTLLKGEAPSKTVYIRQRSSLSPKAVQRISNDLRPKVGERYLFLLSNGMYRFSVAARKGERLTDAVQAQHFALYRSYPMEDAQLLWNDYSQRDTEQAFEALRALDQLLADL
ncbi:MAG: hypothetical protein RhofKO_18090 [Rhodothermales bacterium]